MNIDTLVATIRDAIHDDSATQTWCTTNYGRNHKVYSGINVDSPPGQDDCPLVAIFYGEKDVGYDEDGIRHIIPVTCEIYDADLRTVAGKTNVIEYEFVQNIESFRKLVETAIATALSANYPLIRIARIRIQYETVESFPFIDAAMMIEFYEDYSQGDNVLA